MAEGPRFNKDFNPRYGEAVRVSPLVRRITVNNPGPFTFHGTNTYIIGDDEVVVIDPGPIDPAHMDAMLYAIGMAKVAAIIVTHTHADHSPAARRLALKTGAPIYGEGSHRPSRPLELGEINPFDGSSDHAFTPDSVLADGDRVAGKTWTLTAIATPGHTANHIALALDEEASIFTGDHVMGWSTSIVAPPDGSMSAYMTSLDRLIARPEDRYYPGHGAEIDGARSFAGDLRVHRLGRETGILARLEAGDRLIPDLVAALYVGLDPRLTGAAGLSVLAHLEDLIERGLVERDGADALRSGYRIS